MNIIVCAVFSRERWAVRDIIIVSLVWISIRYSRRKAGTLRDDAIHASIYLSVCLFVVCSSVTSVPPRLWRALLMAHINAPHLFMRLSIG